MPQSPRNRDDVYAKPRAQTDAFTFDANVADVFDDMIRRSVPGYAMTLSLLGIIAQHYAKPATRIYDLGCSLGAGIVAMRSNLQVPGVRFVGIDNSSAMLERCRQNTATIEASHPVDLRCEDILTAPIENASIVVLNFTLQFIEKDQRLNLLQRIHKSLAPNGILVLSEKIRFEDSRIQEDMTVLHHDFKKANGYSALEISQKRNALENVLVPETTANHEHRLDSADFARNEIWLQCFNFASFLAFK